MLGQHSSALTTNPGTHDAALQALAELNILMGSGALPDGSLRSYSCFTRQPRERLWLHYSKYAAGRANCDVVSPQQLELLKFLMEWVLAQ
jgi:hypothetical protein